MTRRKPRPGPGRPPGPPGSQRTARLVVRVSDAEREAYQAAARRAGVSVGEWVRAELQKAMTTIDWHDAPAEKEHGE